MITGASNEQIKRLIRLRTQKKARDAENIFIAEGMKMFLEAPKDRIEKIYVSKKFFDGHGKLFARDGEGSLLSPHILSDGVFARVSDTDTPQGILATVRKASYDIEKVISTERPFFMVADALQDPGNAGTVLRTAEAAGADAVFFTKGSADIYQPKAVRSTMGAIFRVPVFYAEDALGLIKKFHERGVRVYAAYPEGADMYDRQDYSHGTALIVGNEAAGLSEKVAKAADAKISIPMEGKAESLNAAAAAAILMYEVHRQRTAANAHAR